jgi:hypothetical protein
MSPKRGGRETLRGEGPSVLRDPLVPLDLGGWLRRIGGVLRDNATMLLGLGAVLALVGVVFRIALELNSPSWEEMGRQLVIAGRDTPGNYVDRWTVFRIGYLPVLPTFVIFVVLLAVTNAFCTGGAYYRVIRRANGQPTPLTSALRAATPRVLPFIGWWLLAVAGTALAIGALVLLAVVTGYPSWLRAVGPVASVALIVVTAVVVLPTIFGVVFVERRGLRRCVQLVRGRIGLVIGRTLVAGFALAVYVVVARAVTGPLYAAMADGKTLTLPISAIAYLVMTLVNVPMFVFTVAATLVTYAELRHREDSSVTTETLAAEVPTLH